LGCESTATPMLIKPSIAFPACRLQTAPCFP